MNTKSFLVSLIQRTPSRRAPAWRAAGLSLAAAALVASGAVAQEVQVFGTLSNQPPAPGAEAIPLPPSTQLALYVWAYGGDLDSPTGTECSAQAQGDELCGIALSVQSTEGILLSNFAGNPEFDTNTSSPLPFTTRIDPSARNLRTNNFDLGTPPTGMRYIGLLTLDTINVRESDQITMTGEAVGANLEVRPIPPQTVAVPEPGFWLALGAGLLSLAGLAGRSGHALRRGAGAQAAL